MDSELESAVDASLDDVIDSVAGDTIVELLDHQDILPEDIDFDERAIGTAAYAGVSKLDTPLRERVVSEVTESIPRLLRVSRPGDGTAVRLRSIADLAGGMETISGVRSLRNFTAMFSRTDDLGEVFLGVDAEAVANEASDPEKKKTIADAIRNRICGDLREWFLKHLKDIREFIQKNGLKGALKWLRDQVKQLTLTAISALVGIGLSQWAAYLLLGLIVALIGAAIYYLVRYGLPTYCQSAQ